MRLVSVSNRILIPWLGVCLLGLVAGCQGGRSSLAPRRLAFYQTWQIQSGKVIAGYRVNSGLGDIGIDLGGGKVYAPYSGQVQPHTPECVLFSTAQLPAYLFRVCGLHHPRLGKLRAGQAIGAAQSLQFATLRKQPNGTWAFVEPSADLLAKMLHQP
jgi:hypothetical protein